MVVGATKSLGRQWPRERGSRGRRGSSRAQARAALALVPGQAMAS